jgi:arginine decarboxylase
MGRAGIACLWTTVGGNVPIAERGRWPVVEWSLKSSCRKGFRLRRCGDGPLNPLAYNSLWQLRGDAWGKLEDASERLAAAVGQGVRTESLVEEVGVLYELLEPIEHYWGFPGIRRCERARRMFAAGDFDRFARTIAGLNRELATDSYRALSGFARGSPDEDAELRDVMTQSPVAAGRPYFEVLVVERMGIHHEEQLGDELRRLRRPGDEFVYEVVVVPSFEDAVIAVLFNFNIQACVIRRRFSHRSRHDLSKLGRFVEDRGSEDLMDRSPDERAQLLGRRLRELRPELDLYLMSGVSVESIAGRVGSDFRRVFHSREGLLELHLSLLRGVGQRYRAPFFAALRDYSQRPTGVFHALPISRGKSIVNSHWIGDMIDFYGLDVFLAETSATCGGLDSLLEPTGPLREAQELASETFGSRQTYFVTNGTSTGNKIVVQALVRPGDIVLVDRNCHQSHHYGLVQAGAHVTYLEAYGLNDYSIYGAVSLREIKRTLLAFRRAGKLDRVKLLMLTNCTFDGIVYDVERVMEECLAIKPDLVFLWDEAWFAFARFHPVYRSRTAMAGAANLLVRLRDPQYRGRHAAFAEELERSHPDDDRLLELRLLPDPDRTRVRVYATQSTHKTLTSLRQGSMIHVYDQDFSQRVEESFHEAYLAHTSTSPNYQILASLDLGRRQAALEGFELVQKQVEYAISMRDAIDNHPLLRHYMRCLATVDLIPAAFRRSGIEQPLKSGLAATTEAWRVDEFVMDPCRVTVFIGATGIDGDTFKRLHLMDRYGVQINKTSRNTVLFMSHIGTTRSAVAYLIGVLVGIARELEDRVSDMSPRERAAQQLLVDDLTKRAPPLPDFGGFHDAFRAGGSQTPEGDVRRAFYLAYDDSLCEYLLHDELLDKVNAGDSVVSASFVTPYPPGFPVLVPGQVISPEVLWFVGGLDVKEIHGYRAHLGYRVFKDVALQPLKPPAPPPTLMGASSNEDAIAG